MRSPTALPLVLGCAGCLGLGYFLGSSQSGRMAAEPPAEVKMALPFTPAERLGADLYMQTAAEYRACCLGIYQAATLRLETILQTAKPKPPRPAVVMDLDETVLDNSTFESFLYQHNLLFTEELWDVYERDHPEEVALVPGAQGFILKAYKLGVAVIYISNRQEKHRASTLKAMNRLGLFPLDDDYFTGRLFLRTESSSDKSARRELVATRFNVLMYFGDNLRDFSEAFAVPKSDRNDGNDIFLKRIENRLKQVDEASCHWGVDWFVLPNPVYGEWEKLIQHNPKARLRPSKMKLPEPKKSP